MDVVRLPRSFRAALLLFVLVIIPAAALEAVLVTRAQWWKLPYPTLGTWSGVAAALSIPLALWMGSGRRWARKTSVVLGVIWVLVSGVIAIRHKSPALGFFTIFLGVFLSSILLWIRNEMTRSFFDPRLEWYQGCPKAVPGLDCLIVQGENRGPFKVSRMDEEGVFLFLQDAATVEDRRDLFQSGEQELAFVFRDREFRCRGIPVRIFKRGLGGGFQFRNLAPDTEKNLGDFVESLRGEGYVL